jgi:ATP-binding cassette subfamily B multidrug efflux pump
MLFIQAITDLALPGYMADIVNVGIQQNGIESAVPRAVRASEYDKLELIMTDAEKAELATSYTLLDRQALTPDEYASYVKKYPILVDTPIYVATKNGEKNLNAIFSRSILLVLSLEQKGIPGVAGQIPGLSSSEDPFQALAEMTPAQIDGIRNTLDQGIQALPPGQVKQVAAIYLVEEYRVIGIDIGSIQSGYILRVGSIMLLFTLLGAGCSIYVGFLSARVGSGLARDLRQQLFQKVESFSNAEFDKFSTASLITRSTNDVLQIQMLFIMLFRTVFYAPILGIGGIIRVLSSEASMSWIIGVAVLTILGIIVTLLTIAMPKFKRIQKLMDRVNLVTREMLSGLMVIRAFNTQAYEEDKFDKANTDLTKTNLFINRIAVLLMPVMMFVMNVVMILIIWVGSHKVDAGAIQVGDMMAFMQYTMQIIMAFFMVAMVFIMMPRAIVSVTRINEVLETDPVIKDPKDPRKFDEDVKGHVEFQGVSFRYPGAEDDVIKNISFTAHSGQTIAFIGSTGSGKSTIVNLIPRFYDVTSGSIVIDGHDIRKVTQHDLRRKIGYVSQKSLLFSGTIGSNIRYADESLSDDEVTKFAATAQALDFIKSSDQGLESIVTQGASNLSG